eukprot:4819324-Alexandrium_andersonii.AAC.1
MNTDGKSSNKDGTCTNAGTVTTCMGDGGKKDDGTSMSMDGNNSSSSSTTTTTSAENAADRKRTRAM